ncbi:MAG TPA: hypothetical protein VIV15_03215, partial [Anaerolineales bacterium]
ILNGHDHNYQRFAPQDPKGQADPKGIREFVVGTGGAGLYTFISSQPNTEARNDKTFGVLKLTLHASSYDWEFIPITGETFTDSGTANCVTGGTVPGTTQSPSPAPSLTATTTPALPTTTSTPVPTGTTTPPPTPVPTKQCFLLQWWNSLFGKK